MLVRGLTKSFNRNQLLGELQMYYVMVTYNKTVNCHGAFSHEFAAYAKKSRLKKQDPYRQIEIVKTS